MLRFLKARYIIPALTALLILVVVLLYFVGALKPLTIEIDTIDFKLEDFVSYTDKSYSELNVNKLVAENDKYNLYFNEDSTVLTVEVKDTGVKYTTAVPSTYSNNGYTSSLADTNNAQVGPVEQSNMVVYYANKHGQEIATGLNTLANSVGYQNSLEGKYERHYSINYLTKQEDGIDGVQVLYEVGKFSADSVYAPEKVYCDFWENQLRGNVYFKEVIDNYTGEISCEIGACYDKEAAQYIDENGFAEVTIGGEIVEDWDEIENNVVFTLRNIDSDFYNGYGVYLNTPDSPCTHNPFMSSYSWGLLQGYYGIIPVSSDNENAYYKIKTKSVLVYRSLYEMLYTSFEQKSPTNSSLTVVDSEGNPIVRGGYHAQDEDGNFLYDDEGKPVQKLYTLEDVERINNIFGIETELELPRFQIGMQFNLDEDGLKATIIKESIRDSSTYGEGEERFNTGFIVTKVTVLPQLTASYVTTQDAGQIVIPDGSGAIINFNNGKDLLGYTAYGYKIYGDDGCFSLTTAPENTKTLMFPMYGFLSPTENKGVLAIIEQGASISSIYADVARKETPYNIGEFITYLRETEVVNTGYGWYVNKVRKWAEDIISYDCVYAYKFFDTTESLDYVSLAKKYQTYLIDRYGLEFKDSTTNNVVNLNVMGSFDKYQLFLGFKYTIKDSMTTFKQAKEIVNELYDNNVKDMTVSYKAWTIDALEYKLRPSLKVGKSLGGKSGIKSFNDYLSDKGILFYPELFVSTNKGYKYSFGNMKYTSRSVGNDYAIQYPFNLATLQYNKLDKPTYTVSPKFYDTIANQLLKSYKKLGINGAYITDLGNEMVGDYHKDNLLYSEIGIMHQQKALNTLDESLTNLQLSAPFDYALKYATSAVNVPTETSTYAIIDEAIPFYQLVVSGLFDYTTEQINGTNDKSAEWYFAQALITGSNLNFTVSYEDPAILLKTDYTQYYKIYYANWKDKIIDLNAKLTEAGIHKGRLVDHENVNGVSGLVHVTYENPSTSYHLELYVNTTSSDITTNINGLPVTISKYWYYKVGE